eukprot:3738174-Amphidinium_carterae.1
MTWAGRHVNHNQKKQRTSIFPSHVGSCKNASVLKPIGATLVASLGGSADSTRPANGQIVRP